MNCITYFIPDSPQYKVAYIYEIIKGNTVYFQIFALLKLYQFFINFL